MEESLEYVLHSRDSQFYLDLVENYRRKNKVDRSFLDKENIVRKTSDHLSLLEASDIVPYNQKNKFVTICQALSKKWLTILALSMIQGYASAVWTALILNLNTLAFDEISYNGISLALLSIASNMTLSPLLATMKRKRWTIIFQSVLLLNSLALYLLFKYGNRDSDMFKLAYCFMTLFFSGTCANIIGVPLNAWITELFPSHLRGSAFSLIQFASGAICVITPWLCSLSSLLDTHFLVGCSLLGLFSLPLTFFLKETLQ